MTAPTFDVIVIGAGPAGLSAATAAARGGLKTLCLDKLAPGGVLINLGALHDLDEPSDGPQLAAQLADAAIEAGVELGFGEVVRLSGIGPWTVETSDAEQHTARAVVIATGLNKGRLDVPGEEDYEGRGISHCASCDGPLYAGQPVVVAGAEGWAAHEAQELKAFTGQVTVIDDKSDRIVALQGSDGLSAVVVQSAGARKTIPARAVFVYLNQSPAAEFLPDSLARDVSGHIVVDEGCRTSVASAFAAGDVRAGARQSLTEAMADGRRAAQAIVSAFAKS